MERVQVTVSHGRRNVQVEGLAFDENIATQAAIDALHYEDVIEISSDEEVIEVSSESEMDAGGSGEDTSDAGSDDSGGNGPDTTDGGAEMLKDYMCYMCRHVLDLGQFPANELRRHYGTISVYDVVVESVRHSDGTIGVRASRQSTGQLLGESVLPDAPRSPSPAADPGAGVTTRLP